MAEIMVMVTVVVVFLRKFNQISLVHVEWGLVRLEFQQERKKTKRVVKATKPSKEFRSVA